MILPDGIFLKASEEEKEFLVILEEFTNEEGFTCDSHHDDTLDNRIDFASENTSLLQFYKFLNRRKKS